jgi:hypothetical protein
MKWLVAVKARRSNEIFGFKTKRDALAFIKDLEAIYPNIKTALAKAVV